MPSGRNSTRDKDMATADDLEEIKRSLNFMSGELTKLTSQQERVIGLVEEVKTLKAMLIEKDRKIIVLEQRVDELEQYTKRDNLVLTGLKTRHRTYARATANLETTEDAPQEELLTLEQQVVGFLHNLLLQPSISVSSSMDGVSEAQQQGFHMLRGSNFIISCSIQPQYPGGSFQLTFTSSNSAHNYTQPAVNHSVYFLFPEAEPAHQGSYSCVYHLYVFSHNFSSESRLLSVTVSAPDPTPFIIRAVVLLLILLLENMVLYFYCKASRGQKVGRQENIELDYYNLGVAASEGGPTEEEGAQGAE